MVTRFIDAIEKATGIVRDTEVITNDNLVNFDIPTIFPGLDPGLYNFQARSELTPDYEVTNPLPTITGAPTVSGTIRTGQTLTANPAPVTGDPIPTRTWQWQRLVSGSWSNIAGATAGTYVLTAADEGMSVRVRQTETNVGGTASADSDPFAVPFLLDQLTAVAEAAYSTRRLTSGATNSFQCQRTDNALQNIDFGTNGRLDTTALASFVGSNSGFVQIWYDQMVGRDISAPAANRRPRIVNAGVNDTLGGRVAPFFAHATVTNCLTNASPFMQAAGAASIFVVQDCAPANGRFLLRERNTAGNATYELRAGFGSGLDNQSLGVIGRNDANTSYVNDLSAATLVLNSTPTVLALRDAGNAYEPFRNGTRTKNAAYTRSGVSTLNEFSVGGINSADTGVTGRIAEVIIFTSAISNEDLNTIIASQGGEYGITVQPFLTDEETEFAGLARDGVFARSSTNWEGYTANTALGDAGLAGGVGYPFLHRSRFLSTSGAANRVTAPSGQLARFDTLAYPYYDGGKVRVFRVTNGVMSQVRESTITGGKIGGWNWVQFGSNDSRVIDGTSFRFQLDTWNRPNVPYWFRVAAVGADGLSGAWSAPVSYTPTSVSGAANTVPNTPKAFNRIGSGGALGAPTGLAAVAGNSPRVASLTWNAVAGAEGYIVEQTYYDPATQIDTTEYLDLASDPTPILATDLVIVEKQFLTLNENLFCSRVFGTEPANSRKPPMFWFDTNTLKRDGNDWSYVAYSGDKPAGIPNDHFFRRTATAGQTALMQYYWHSGTAQTFYAVLTAGQTYRLRVIMRASSPVNVTFNPGGVAGVLSTVFDNVPSTWTEYTYDMTPTATRTDGTPSDWTLSFTAGGSAVNFDVALFEIFRVGVPRASASTTPMAANSVLRDHSFVKPGNNNRSMLRMCTDNNYSYKRYYELLVEQGAKPWFLIEWNTPKEDWLNFVAYLAAPNGTHPYADFRQQSGIPEPWTTLFPDIRLEFGLEAWQSQSMTEFWSFPGSMVDSATSQVYLGGSFANGEVAGLFWQMISNWLKESPYWSTLAPKLRQHLGGWVAGSFGAQAFRYYPDAVEVSTAPYNGGWEGGSTVVSETGQSFNVILTDSLVVQKPRSTARINELKSVCTQIGKVYGTDVRPDIYEAGPGYQINGMTLDQTIRQEVVMKSRASAVATVDTMLLTGQQGFKSWSFFNLGGGSRWASHAPSFDGGQEYLVHALPRIIHEQMAPCEVWGALTSSLGLKTGETNSGSTAEINQIGAYQLRSIATPSKRMIVLINRNLDPSQLDPSDPRYSATPSGSVLFNLETGWTSANSLRVWTAGIGPYRQHNRYPVGQRRGVTPGTYVSDPLSVAFDYSSQVLSVPPNVGNFPINASVGATVNGLPAGNCLIMLFEGVTGG